MNLVEQIEKLNSKLNQLEEQKRESELRLIAVLSSRSWAVTKPLRAYAALRREDAVDRMVKRYERKLLSLPRSVTISALSPKLESFEIKTDYSVGAVIHVHFIDVLDELINPLALISNLKNLYITYNDSSIKSEIDLIVAKHLDSKVVATLLLVENRGRDVLPFLKVLDYLESNPDQQCDAYLKLHTKKSTHLESGTGGGWRDGLIRSLVPLNVDAIAGYASSNPNLGFIAPLRWTSGADSWGRNRRNVKVFMKRGGYKTRAKLLFPAGTMFWFNSHLIDLLKPIAFQSEDFDAERGQLDGTAAHAFERLVGRVSVATKSDIWLMS